MAEQKIRISQLPKSSDLEGLRTLGVDKNNESVQVPLGEMLQGIAPQVQSAIDAANTATTTAAGAVSTAEAASTQAAEAKQAAEAAEESIATEVENMQNGVQTAVVPRTFINANVLFKKSTAMSLETVYTLFVEKGLNTTEWLRNGTVVTFLTTEGWRNYRFLSDNAAADAGKAEMWQVFGNGNAAIGNCYNVTNEQPISGYYNLETAIAATYDKDLAAAGMQITFSIAQGSWKTYQFIGSNIDEITFKSISNWIDLAGMTAGEETLINVDALCGPCISHAFYTLEYAIAAIVSLQQETGITYAKGGLVITYKVGDNKWETKQFNGAATDFGEASLWKDFGGGGTAEVETKDTPEENGKDAFSTGGAFERLPTELNATYEDNVLKMSLVNEKGETIGTEKQFIIQSGGGTGGGTIVTITPESSPFYTKAGGTVVLKAAIRSVTVQGSKEQDNMIERVELYDRDTNQLLETYRLNQASSATDKTYDFEFDLSSYFPLASQRRFKLIAYDDSEHNGSRNINVTAVDVTVKSEQTLNYTASTAIEVGGAAKTLPMYRFPNNASDKGILCTSEIFIDGGWLQLGQATVLDTYSHSISINPNNCAGKVLSHGAYPIRIHGEDIASGVVGNYLHTAIMVVESNNTTPIVATRWYSESLTATVKQYETLSVDFAVYSSAVSAIQAEVRADDTVKQTTLAQRSVTYTYTQRVSGVETDGSVSIDIEVRAGSTTSQTSTFNVIGSLLDIQPVTAQLMFDMDMAGRSNTDSNKSITDGGYTLTVQGANYTTNGFVKDSFGTEDYGTEQDPGVMALRIAENVTAELNYKPFNVASIETNGLAIQFRIRTKHVADDTARLISCISSGIGFYVTGKNVVFTTDDGATVAHTITSALKDDSLTDVAIVIEPTSQAPYGGIGVVKMYFDGELIGTCYYDAGSLSRHSTPVTFDGTQGDLYLYNIRAWETYYSFEQSFNNYLLKMVDADAMITEFNNNQVMASQSAEGKPATNRPQANALYNIGIPYFVVCKNANTENQADNYPEYLETLDGDKKTSRILDVYAYFPDRPWQDFKAIGVTVSNQGTTSSMRPIKNIKMKFKKATITLLRSRDEFSGETLLKYDECAANAAKSRVQPKEGSVPTNIITVKVDYSESGGANNGASATLYNELQKALGVNYITPAQAAYTGKYNLYTSIDSIPCAFFRTDIHSSDATSPSYGYFHAKGNWNDDKGDAAVFGFEGVDGYNADCLNYGDFVEVIAARNQSLTDFDNSIDKTAWDTEQIYVLSEFCGPLHKVYRYQNGAWTETTGTMTYSGGRWRITGDVVNPVENYELRTYNALDWFQGVNTMDDMLALDSDGVPIWLTYFESRYPDDDNLNAAYEDGRKLPYQLYRWLRWCQDCNHNLTEADGNITIDGVSASGTKANRLLKFKRELHKIANVHSMICYHIFTDYIAAVDQRSKNMMVGFYLERDGNVRMYLNHLYDGDTVLGSDNDCGLTIPAELDPNNDEKGYYQGHDSVLFKQLAASDFLWLTDYVSDADTSDTTRTCSVKQIADVMRKVELASGLRPFSPQGIEKYWIADRLSKWPKLVSSYDGIRKYIEASESNDNYFFALHGLSIQRLQDYVETRFRFRDGFYGCGDIYESAVSMRCTGTNMSITITAAKDGFFGVGVDQTHSMRESVYLKAGETATLHTGASNDASGYMLYLYGADRIGELDIRNATPKQQGWDISQLTLLKKLIIGGENYTPATNSGEELSVLNLGQLPFLEEVDVRNFPLVSINAEYCPRLVTVLAGGSQLQIFTPAQTSPISTLELPGTMQSLTFVNLPNLKYPNGGLTIEGYNNVTRLQVSGCANIDDFAILTNIVESGAALAEISIPEINVTADTTMLDALIASNVKGIGSDLDHGCDGLAGTWILTKLIDDSALDEYKAYFHELNLHNSQFTLVMFDDTISDPANVTNLDNSTGHAFNNEYIPSGHIVRIRENLFPVFGKLNTQTGQWEGERISDTNYQKLYDGSNFDYADNTSTNRDAMMYCKRLWYKGINDFKNQKKYIAWSSLETKPLSTAKTITRRTLSDILYRENSAVYIESAAIGVATLETAGVLQTTTNYNVYSIDVKGMKQVRYPGLNSAQIGGVFLNAAGVVVGVFNMAISNTLFDFVEGEYIFTSVPADAKTFVFASKNTNNDLEAIAVDSAEIEAIEPDWVMDGEWLGGIYHASIDGMANIRSVSQATVRVQNGQASTTTTHPDWTYDEEGKPTNSVIPTGLRYTGKDFQNLAALRGAGYQLFDYEMSKLMAILFFSLTGNRDSSLLCGRGKSAGGTTGYTDALGNRDSKSGEVSGNKCLGFESFFGCTWEFMDNVAVNVPTYAQALAEEMKDNINSYPIDAKWHIYDPINKTERVVAGITDSGRNIARVKHGRFCDVIASKCSTDGSVYATYYADANYYTASRCRVVGRSDDNAVAGGGVAFASASSAFSVSNSSSGSRLAFRPQKDKKIIINE